MLFTALALDTSDCRFAYCPTGQVPMNNGRCGHLATQWNNVKFDINLKLLPKQTVNIDTVRNTNFQELLTNKSLSISPWSKHWKIVFFAYKPITVNVNVSIVDYFLVRLEHINRRINTKSFFTNTERNLIKEWIFYINGHFVPNWQEISEYTTFLDFPNGLIAPSNKIPLQESLSFIRNLTMPIFQTLVRNFFERNNHFILTKMFFCDQIILKPDEYKYDPRLKILLHIGTGNVFYNGEIVVAYDEIFEYIPKLCLNDAGFELVSKAIIQRLSMTYVCWVLLIVIFC